MHVRRSTTGQLLMAMALLVLAPVARAQESPVAPGGSPSACPPDQLLFAVPCVRFQLPEEQRREACDLTLETLFTAGWCEEYQERPTAGRAERIILFRTLAPFLERELVGNYRFALRSRPTGVNEHEIGPEMLVPVNRRLGFDAELSYDFNGDNQPGAGGAAGSVAAMLQLVDTSASAVNFQVNLATPGRDDLLDHRLFMGLALAGFRDLGARFGLQGSLGVNLPLGSSHETGADVEATYAVALTKTLTDDMPWIGHFTPFVELAGATDLGVTQRHAYLTILPGAEWEVIRTWDVAIGLEVPLTGPRPFDLGFHFSLIKSF